MKAEQALKNSGITLLHPKLKERLIEAITEYGRRNCQEQRELCKLEVMKNSNGTYFGLEGATDRDNIDKAIENAPEPKL